MSHSHYFLTDPSTGRIRFTTTGRDALGARFARAGIDLQQIDTLEKAQRAAAQVSHQELLALAAHMKGRDPVIDPVMAGLPEWDHAPGARP